MLDEKAPSSLFKVLTLLSEKVSMVDRMRLGFLASSLLRAEIPTFNTGIYFMTGLFELILALSYRVVLLTGPPQNFLSPKSLYNC